MRLPASSIAVPNQQGVFESDAVSLGAARLKIIDIEGGDQPIISKMATPSSSSTARSTITWNCAANWNSAGIVSAPAATPKRF
jgi:hypothetical protein